MTVQMNDKEINVFAGARVRDVLLKYSKESYRAALSETLSVVDKNENAVDLDGEVSDGQRLYTREKK
ncbi:MAG: hypothetical protein GY950_13995 [bacterium]|nr:hypothetical protein [bacterium]